MCSHNGHWSWVHFNDAITDRSLPTLVLPGSRLWTAAFVLDEESAGSLAGRLPAFDVIGLIQSYTAASFAGTGVD